MGKVTFTQQNESGDSPIVNTTQSTSNKEVQKKSIEHENQTKQEDNRKPVSLNILSNEGLLPGCSQQNDKETIQEALPHITNLIFKSDKDGN